MKKIELEDITKFRFLSDVQYAPGGGAAAFVVSHADVDGNAYESHIWLYENGEIRRLTGLGKESGFAWLDDHRLLFAAARSAAEKKRAEKKDPFTAYYVIDVRGGEAEPFLTAPFSARGITVLDETHFALTGGIDADCPDLYLLSGEEREKALKEKEEDRDYEVIDELPFWFNGAGFVNKKRTALFLADIGGNEPAFTRVTEPMENAGLPEVLGDELIFSTEEYTVRQEILGFRIDAVDWKTGARRRIFETDEYELQGMKAAGDVLYVAATDGKRHGLNENAWIFTLDPASGKMDLLRREEYSIYGSVGSDCRLGGGLENAVKDGSMYHVTTREGSALLFRLDRDGGSVPVITKEGSIDCFSVCEENDTVLLIAMYDMKLQELYAFENGELKQISHFNDDVLAERYVAQPERLETQSAGMTIGGWVLKPVDFDPEKTYPAVLDIHGGPKTVYGPVFMHEMQLWASMGYFVFYCNPKGSDGRDSAFMDIRGDYGGTDYVNLMDFTDAVLAAYPQIDPARVCETGGSYGGFMTNWIIGHTDRFCCAASQRSISNWLSFYGVSDIGPYFSVDQTAGDPFDSPEKMWEQSPLKYAKNVKTPTLFIHSDEDYRCPLEQGLQMVTALMRHGVPTRLCLFHGENHELSRSGKPKHRLRRLKEITDWFERYAK